MRNKKLAEALVKLRGDKSREEVAVAIGISVSALSMYEIGERTPRDEIKKKISAYYGVDIITLFYSH